jgi:hypothetical protein
MQKAMNKQVWSVRLQAYAESGCYFLKTLLTFKAYWADKLGLVALGH